MANYWGQIELISYIVLWKKIKQNTKTQPTYTIYFFIISRVLYSDDPLTHGLVLMNEYGLDTEELDL